jgi:hypothetical protein
MRWVVYVGPHDLKTDPVLQEDGVDVPTVEVPQESPCEHKRCNWTADADTITCKDCGRVF